MGHADSGGLEMQLMVMAIKLDLLSILCIHSKSALISAPSADRMPAPFFCKGVRNVNEITSRFILRLSGALLRCPSLVWNDQTARRAALHRIPLDLSKSGSYFVHVPKLRYVFYLWFVLTAIFPLSAMSSGIVTLLEGKALLTRGVNRYVVVEGTHLEKGDILDVADNAFAEVEFDAGDRIAAGPQTRMMLVSAASKSSGNEWFLLQGQLKANVRGSEFHRLISPIVTVSVAEATAVLQLDNAGTALFMERGEAKVEELSRGKATGKPLQIKSGEFYSRKEEQRSAVAPRPPATFVSGLPRPFLDSLPSRFDKFKDRNVELKKAPDFSYADMEAWLKSPAQIRKTLVPRWQTKARDPAFRKALIANLKDHPEWNRVLFPEKYNAAAKAKAGAAPSIKQQDYRYEVDR